MYFPTISILDKFVAWDRSLFKVINKDWANSLFDVVMPFLRTPTHWVPLYLFLLVFVLLNFRKNRFWWIIFFISTVGMTDMIGTNVFKYGFARIRPCNNPEMFEYLRLLVVCPSGYGFTSNHAANHFGMATFLFITFRHLFKNWMFLAFFWAAAICYAQIYVGVHYPTDIIGGAMLGILMGSLTGYGFEKILGGLDQHRQTLL